MENNRNVIRIMLIAVVLLAAFAAVLYTYPYNPVKLKPQVQQNISNSIKLADFLSTYNINLSALSDKDLYYFYGGLPNNSIVFGCNYEMEPAFPTVPLNESIISNEYNNIVRDIVLISMCSVENYTNCTAEKKQLYSFMNQSLNSNEVSQLFKFVYSNLEGYYNEIVRSGFENSTLVDPLKYDIKLFNESKNESAMINALIGMKQMPVNIVFNREGNMLDYLNETPMIYSPFQFQVFRLINATGCSYSNIFNIVVDPKYFSSKTYSYIYKGFGNVTNICIVNSENSCNSTELKDLNFSFYAN